MKFKLRWVAIGLFVFTLFWVHKTHAECPHLVSGKYFCRFENSTDTSVIEVISSEKTDSYVNYKIYDSLSSSEVMNLQVYSFNFNKMRVISAFNMGWGENYCTETDHSFFFSDPSSTQSLVEYFPSNEGFFRCTYRNLATGMESIIDDIWTVTSLGNCKLLESLDIKNGPAVPSKILSVPTHQQLEIHLNRNDSSAEEGNFSPVIQVPRKNVFQRASQLESPSSLPSPELFRDSPPKKVKVRFNQEFKKSFHENPHPPSEEKNEIAGSEEISPTQSDIGFTFSKSRKRMDENTMKKNWVQNKRTKRTRRSNFPAPVIQFLRVQYFGGIIYPTSQVKQLIMDKINKMKLVPPFRMTRTQVDNWFSNQRARRRKFSIDSEEFLENKGFVEASEFCKSILAKEKVNAEIEKKIGQEFSQSWTVEVEKHYFCHFEKCGRVFNKAHSLTRHFRTHTGERPYICNFRDCGNTFSESGNLVRHQKLHKLE